jgi:phosphoribosylformylglycinamidine synthase
MKDSARMATIAFKAEGEAVILVGESKGHLGQSLYLREIAKREDGLPPPVDLKAERRNGEFVRGLIERGELTTCHDCSDGGLLVAIAEMAMASGIGAEIATPAGTQAHEFWYGEDQARYVLAVPVGKSGAILAAAQSAGVPAQILGTTGGGLIALDGSNVSIRALKDPHEAWLPELMRG